MIVHLKEESFQVKFLMYLCPMKHLVDERFVFSHLFLPVDQGKSQLQSDGLKKSY